MELVNLDNKNKVKFQELSFYQFFTTGGDVLYIKIGDSLSNDNAYAVSNQIYTTFDSDDIVSPKIITKIEYKSK